MRSHPSLPLLNEGGTTAAALLATSVLLAAAVVPSSSSCAVGDVALLRAGAAAAGGSGSGRLSGLVPAGRNGMTVTRPAWAHVVKVAPGGAGAGGSTVTVALQSSSWDLVSHSAAQVPPTATIEAQASELRCVRAATAIPTAECADSFSFEGVEYVRSCARVPAAGGAPNFILLTWPML
jgi:hypothetical protein